MISCIAGALAKIAVGTNTFYEGFQASGNLNATETRINSVCPIAGTVNALYVNTDVSPGGAGKSITITPRKNATDQTSSAVTISNAATSGNSTTSFSVAAGDILSNKYTGSGTPASIYPSVGYQVTSTNSNESPIMGSCVSAFTAGATNYMCVQGTGGNNATESNREQVVPTALTISKAYALLDTATLTSTVVITLFKNGLSTGFSVTVATNGTSANNTGSVSFAAGDTWSWQVTNNGTATPRVAMGAVANPSTDGESIGLISSAQTLAQASTLYLNPGLAQSVAWNGTENQRQVTVITCVVKKLNVLTTSVGGSGQSLTTTVRKNAVTAGISCVINSGSTTGTDNSNTYSATNGDLIAIQGVTTATTGTLTPQIGIVYYVAPVVSGQLIPFPWMLTTGNMQDMTGGMRN